MTLCKHLGAINGTNEWKQWKQLLWMWWSLCIGQIVLVFVFAIAIAFVWGFSFFHYLSRLYILPPLPLPFWWCWCIPPPLGPRVLWICVCGLASAAQAWGVLLRHVCLPVLWYFFCHASEPYGVFFYAACTKKHSRHIFSTGMGGKSQVNGGNAVPYTAWNQAQG